MTSALLDRLCEIAPPVMDEFYSDRRCIAATKTAVEVLGYFGISARPVKTMTIAGNQAWEKWLAADKPEPTPDEVWAVGTDLAGGDYPGHLVAIVDLHGVKNGALLDLSVGQFSRPERGLLLPRAVWFPLDAESYDKDRAVIGYADDQTGAESYLVYRFLPERDWTRAKDWRRKPATAGTLIRALRADT